MDNSENYLINMRDGRLILFTKQAIRQVDYHPISREVAIAIGDGRVTAMEVVSRIKANLLNNQDAWDDLLKRKTTMNVRKSTLTPDDAEGLETSASAEDMKGAFEMPSDTTTPPATPVNDVPPPAKETHKKTSGKKTSSKKEEQPAVPAPVEGESDSHAEAGETAPETLTI
jgi:hypothetical protein